MISNISYCYQAQLDLYVDASNFETNIYEEIDSNRYFIEKLNEFEKFNKDKTNTAYWRSNLYSFLLPPLIPFISDKYNERIANMTFASVYPHYVNKIKKKEEQYKSYIKL